MNLWRQKFFSVWIIFKMLFYNVMKCSLQIVVIYFICNEYLELVEKFLIKMVCMLDLTKIVRSTHHDMNFSHPYCQSFENYLVLPMNLTFLSQHIIKCPLLMTCLLRVLYMDWLDLFWHLFNLTKYKVVNLYYYFYY